MVTNSIEKAQRKVEGRNFDIRKQLLEFDDVANDQRQIVYQQRNELLEADDISETIDAIRADVVNEVVSECVPPQSIEEQWDISMLEQRLEAEFALKLPIQQWLDEDDQLHEEPLRQKIIEAVQVAYEQRCAEIGPEIRVAEKQIMLQVLDALWKEHLSTMDHLRQGIGLRAYAQKNPKQEYKREAFALFEAMLDNLKFEVIKFLSHIRMRSEEEIRAIEAARRLAEEKMQMEFNHPDASSAGMEAGEQASEAAQPDTFVRQQPKVGRNEPCPCGSGKKYKQCHGKLA
jgi:preprotein translocase subunit SecA